MEDTYSQFKSCIEKCFECAAVCNHCASSCIQEENVNMMARCIQLDMECATICIATGQLMSLGNDRAKDLCRICSDICLQCAKECSKHDHVHCQACADVCNECAQECLKMAA
jgi:hypothetical protein